MENHMKVNLALSLITLAAFAALSHPGEAQLPQDSLISPSRSVPTGKAPHMQVKQVKDSTDEKVFAVIFYRGDEALSGLTDFVIQHKIQDAHFTGIGAVSGGNARLARSGKQDVSPHPCE
jgi:hypothetical protein